MENTLTGVPITQAVQQRPYEVHDNLSASQDLNRGWEIKETVTNIGSVADPGVASLSPTDTSGIVREPVLPNMFSLAINCYGFDYSVLEIDQSEEAKKKTVMIMTARLLLLTIKTKQKRKTCKSNTGKTGTISLYLYKKEEQRRAFWKT